MRSQLTDAAQRALCVGSTRPNSQLTGLPRISHNSVTTVLAGARGTLCQGRCPLCLLRQSSAIRPQLHRLSNLPSKLQRFKDSSRGTQDRKEAHGLGTGATSSIRPQTFHTLTVSPASGYADTNCGTWGSSILFGFQFLPL